MASPGPNGGPGGTHVTPRIAACQARGGGGRGHGRPAGLGGRRRRSCYRSAGAGPLEVAFREKRSRPRSGRLPVP